MAKTDFLSIMVRDVELKWPRLNATYRFNTAEKRSEECPPKAQGAAYSCAWEMNKDDAGKLLKQLKDHFAACKPDKKFTKVFGMKKLESGNIQFSAKRNGVNGQGELSNVPVVIDGQKQPLADRAIWTGSRGSLKVTAYPVTDPQGDAGISMLLDITQVTHAVYGGSGLDDFDSVTTTMSGGEDASLDDFGPAKAAADPFADIPAAKDNADLDDEIPF